MNKNIIPVAFATDENYAMPLSVAMTSLLENANETTHYDIYVLIDKEFSTETKDRILTLQDRYSNCKIEFISLEHKFDDVKIKTHVTKVGRYRLLLGSLLPDIDKCIYLDCDIIVQKDLTEMFNIDIENYYVAGVKDAYTIFEYGQNHADEIGVSKIDQYINSGVLVLNLDKIRKDKLEKIFLELTKRKFTRYVDQDIINIACYDKIKHINLKYNLQTLLFRVINNKISTQNCVKVCFESTEITESIEKNIIMHYSSSPKPWDNKSINCSEIWWKYYDLSPYNRNLIKKQNNENLNVVFICEENNIKSLSVAITSLLENINNVKYQINILSTDNFSNQNQELLYKFQEKYNCNITFNTSENINKSSCEDISKTISNFYENIDRCIYLDYNIIAQGDLTELLNFDLINNSIGGVRQIDDEINSSVLLIDCDKVRDNTIEIGEIDIKFNLQAYLLKGEKTFKFGKQVEIKSDLVEKFDKKQLKSALRDNVIFSYTDDINPFTCDSCSFSYIWWKYFRLSPFSKLKRISPKVSAILPVYNVGKYLRECLDSLINQTLEDIEIILVNDGSTDNSLEILREYAEFDKRIIILDQENQGAATARNNGLAIARGEYLSILDSDDFFDLTLLEKAYNNAIENDSDIVVYNYMGFNNNNEHFNKVNHMFPPINGAFSYKDIPDQIFNTLSHNAWSKMFKAEFIKNIDVKFQCVYRTDDVYFTNMALLQAKRITTIDNHLVYYRIGISSQSTSAREPLSFVDAWKEVLSKIKSLGLYNEVEKSFVNSMLHSTLYHLSIMKNTDGYELVYDYIANELDRDFELSKCENGIIHPQLYSAYNSIKNKQSYENDYIVNSSLEDLEIDDTRVKMSVIIPVYNAEKFLKESIDSVIKQSLKNIEIICVDDGSTDKSLKILNKLAKDNKNITVLTQKNQYACVARNNGLSKATGEYIFFFDCDDILYDNKVLENMYVIAKQNNLDVLRGKAVTFDSDTKKIIEDAYYNLSNIPKNYFNRLLDLNTDYKAIFSCSNTPWSGICNREFLINNNIKFPNLISCEDESFFIETVLKAERITIADINILKYRVNNNTSFVLARFVHFDHLFKSYELIENLCKEYSNDISLFVLNLHLSGRLYWLQRSENSQYFIDNLRLCKEFLDNLDYSYWGGKDNCQLYNRFCKYFEYVMNFAPKSQINNYNYYKNVSSEFYEDELKEWYKRATGENLDFVNPKTFNEKIQWLKLYDSTPLKTRLADKYLVRDWIKEKIGEEYLIPLLGVWNSFDEIDFDKLPNQFALKTNHGSGWNYIVKDKSKFDKEDAKKKFDVWMKLNYAFISGLELHYLNIKPKIIAEKYIQNIDMLDVYNKRMEFKNYIINSFNKEILILCSPQKTGNTTIRTTFKSNNINIFTTGHKPCTIDINFLNKLDNNIKIITAVREPIIQNISSLYEQISSFVSYERKWVVDLVKNDWLDTGGNVDNIFRVWLKNYGYENKNLDINNSNTLDIHYFFNSFKENIIDLSKYPFDHEKGYTIIKEGKMEIFVYQLEKMNDILKEMSDWIGHKELDKWVMANEASSKWIANSYKQAQKEIKFSQEYFDRCYNDPWVQHFYSQEDIEKFKERWRPHIKE